MSGKQYHVELETYKIAEKAVEFLLGVLPEGVVQEVFIHNITEILSSNYVSEPRRFGINLIEALQTDEYEAILDMVSTWLEERISDHLDLTIVNEFGDVDPEVVIVRPALAIGETLITIKEDKDGNRNIDWYPVDLKEVKVFDILKQEADALEEDHNECKGRSDS